MTVRILNFDKIEDFVVCCHIGAPLTKKTGDFCLVLAILFTFTWKLGILQKYILCKKIVYPLEDY